MSGRAPIIRIANGTFYRYHPDSSGPNPPLFSNLNLTLPSDSSSHHNWCVVGPSLSGKTTFLQILGGQHLCIPSTARSYPYLTTNAVPPRLRSPSRAIQYVGFDAARSSRGLGAATRTYLAARYESRREWSDVLLVDFLVGKTQVNASEASKDDRIDPGLLERVVLDLRLETLLHLPLGFLSNGQGRRAVIARALLAGPEVLLLDEPFVGLDPRTVAELGSLLQSLADKAKPRLVLSARPQDPLPAWITHLAYLRAHCQMDERMGKKSDVVRSSSPSRVVWQQDRLDDNKLLAAGQDLSEKLARQEVVSPGEPLVDLSGCQVRYGDRTVLGNWTETRAGIPSAGLYWTVRRGERWAVFGPNGSGKTTLVSLLCSDHPQTYSLPIKLFGRSRLPEPGSGQLPLTYWDVQSRIGHSSPEVHKHMPSSLSIRQVLESAWAVSFQSKPRLDDAAPSAIDASLTWFRPELNPASGRAGKDLGWANNLVFGELSFSAQRVLLFLRAIIKHPDIVVLDEAFAGMDDALRDKCLLFLAHGEDRILMPDGSSTELRALTNPHVKPGCARVMGLSEQQALVCISHVKEEVPDCVGRWMYLPDAHTGETARFGRLDRPLSTDGTRWGEIWGLSGSTRSG